MVAVRPARPVQLGPWPTGVRALTQVVKHRAQITGSPSKLGWPQKIWTKEYLMSVSSQDTHRGSRVKGKLRRLALNGDLRTALVFLLPATIGLVVFYILPAIRGFYYSFTDYSVLQAPSFVGTENYERMVDDPLFWNALWVTIYYVVLNIGFQTVIAIGLALLMYHLTKSTLIRGMALLPYFIANVVIALVWYFMILDYRHVSFKVYIL